ncbi:MAG: hypothetical protein P1R58_02025 [bacterium]|nr:hypothetical protein [bacterium]
MEILSNLLDTALALSGQLVSLFGRLATLVAEQFGRTGQLAFYLVLIVITLLAAWKALSLLFSILRYLVIPSVAVAWLGSLFLPYTFTTLLPVSTAGCSLVLLYKA